MKPITEIQKQKEIDYSQEIVTNFWVQKDFAQTKKQNTNLITFHGNLEKITDCINGTTETLLIYSSEFSNELLNAILNVSQSVRVYLLTSDYHSKRAELKSLAENCLIRFLNTTYKGSFVLSDIQSKFRGFYFNGSFLSKDLEDNQRYLLALETEQREFFFQLFCEWFWKETEQEILTKEQSESPLKIESQPFDFLFPKPEYIASDRISKLMNEMITEKSNIHLSLKKIDKKVEDIIQRSNSAHCIYTNLQNNEIDSLNALYEKNKIYVFEDCQNENFWEFLTNHQDTFFILNRKNLDEFGWIFELTKSQIQEFSRILQNVNLAYEYRGQDKRGNLQKKKIYLTDKKGHKDIKEIDTITIEKIEIPDLKSIQDEKDFASKEPKQFIDPLFSSRTIFQWKIHPPVLPEHSDKDPLYYEWEKNHNEIITLMSNQIKKVEDIGKEEGLFLKFTGLFKSSNQKSLVEIQKELEKEREKLQQRKLPELSESERITLKSTLEQLCKEIEEQKKTKIKDVEEFKKKKQEELDKQNNSKQEIDKFIKNLSNQKDSKNNQFKQLEQKKSSIQNKIKKQADQIESEQKNSEQEQGDELLKIDLQLESLQKEIETIIEEKEKKEKDLDSFLSIIKNSEKEINDIKSSNLSKIDSKSFDIQFPTTLLPKVGVLYQNKNRERFLTIENWEELEQGKVEAERLNAILCINNKSNSQTQTKVTKEDKTVW